MSSPAGREERQVLTAYLTRHRLKRSAQREAILDAFVRAGHHVSVEAVEARPGARPRRPGQALVSLVRAIAARLRLSLTGLRAEE